jgi:threonine efflux protein
MDFWHGFFLITVIHLAAAASPGPDFVLVTQRTLSHGKKAGVLCSLGIALGLAVHLTYSAFGLAIVVVNSLPLLWTIKMLGGGYLIYLGLKGLRSTRRNFENVPAQNIVKENAAFKTIGIGFLCNALNPKAPIYFVSLFTLVLSPEMPFNVIIAYGLWIMCLQFAWFSFVAMILSSSPVSHYFRKFGHYIDRLLGGAMLALGIKVIVSSNTTG